jgi:hypothetical protein
MIIFGCIYSVDCSKVVTLRDFRPLFPSKWHITETAADDYEDVLGKNYKHRKYCGAITKEELDKMIHKRWLNQEVSNTMGSLGCIDPNGQMILGMVPAVSFGYFSDGVILNLYATPFVVRPARTQAEKDSKYQWFPVRNEASGDRDWERLEDAMFAKWCDISTGKFSRLRSRRTAAEQPLSCRD